jgi:hypothetical protein
MLPLLVLDTPINLQSPIKGSSDVDSSCTDFVTLGIGMSLISIPPKSDGVASFMTAHMAMCFAIFNILGL